MLLAEYSAAFRHRKYADYTIGDDPLRSLIIDQFWYRNRGADIFAPMSLDLLSFPDRLFLTFAEECA